MNFVDPRPLIAEHSIKIFLFSSYMPVEVQTYKLGSGSFYITLLHPYSHVVLCKRFYWVFLCTSLSIRLKIPFLANVK